MVSDDELEPDAGRDDLLGANKNGEDDDPVPDDEEPPETMQQRQDRLLLEVARMSAVCSISYRSECV